MTSPAVRLTGIDKSFGPVRANRGAELEVAPGKIHALVGFQPTVQLNEIIAKVIEYFRSQQS